MLVQFIPRKYCNLVQKTSLVKSTQLYLGIITNLFEIKADLVYLYNIQGIGTLFGFHFISAWLKVDFREFRSTRALNCRNHARAIRTHMSSHYNS